MRAFWIAAATVTALASPTLAENGDIYRCVMDGFRHGSPSSSPDPAFVEGNMRKTFDIFDLGNRYKVIANTKDFRPATDEYEILRRDLIATIAIDKSALNSLDGLVLYDPPENAPDQRVKATITRQGSSSVNVWYLSCISL